MTANTTPTATAALAPTGQQRQMIADLSAELGREIAVPVTRKAASVVISKAITEKQALDGDKPAPTSAQVRLLQRLAAERGRDYKIPATRKQASARIAQILNATKPAPTPAAA